MLNKIRPATPVNNKWLDELMNKDCEIIVFEVFDKFKGTGTSILDKLKEIAKDKKCQRIYLVLSGS